MGDLREQLLKAGLVKNEPLDPRKVANAGRVEGKTRGNRRWYYTARAGNVPHIDVSDEMATQLEQGLVAIVESPAGDAWLVHAEAAGKLREAGGAAAEWLRVWNRKATA